MPSLNGRRVLVTGAAGSLGSATVAALRALGATVAGLDLVVGDGIIGCDVCDDSGVAVAVAQARQRMRGIDAVVHFAGIGVPTSAGKPPGETALRTLDVTFSGPGG